METIVCMYSCGHCGIDRAEVEVPIRAADTDVRKWMDQELTPALVADHEARSPDCRPDVFREVLIPCPPGTTRVGGPPEH